MTPKRWYSTAPMPADQHQQWTDFHPIIAQLLYSRGVETPAAALHFLSPSLDQLAPPESMKGLSAAVERINQSIAANEKIVIYGDYDVDGICSTVLLYETLRLKTPSVDYYVPDRNDEGYGLSTTALTKLKEKGTQLIITVDTGITAVEAVHHAKKLGMAVIVTDHHQPGPTLPAAFSILNPLQEGCAYPFKSLAGCGVVLRLCQYLREGWRHPGLTPAMLELSGLATIADIVPLVGENRILAKFGLAAINQTSRLGLRALIHISRIQPGSIDSYHVGFQLGPRLNAAGRMAHANSAIRLLLTNDPTEANQLALYLDEQNQSRRELTETLCREAIAQIDPGRWTQVICGEGWPAGILGLVAGKICEKTYRPTIVFGQEDNHCHGSARSISGFDIVAALRQSESLLDRFGGHAMAAGLTLKYEQLNAFRQQLETTARTQLDEAQLIPSLQLTCHLPLESVDTSLHKQLELLAPFGLANPKPVFWTEAVSFDGLRLIGKEQTHIKGRVRYPRGVVEMVGFQLASRLPDLANLPRQHIAYTVETNTWQGRTSLQLNLRDLRPASDPAPEIRTRQVS